MIFESHDSEMGWNGTYATNGEPCADGVYVWKINFTENFSDKRHSIKGHVTLLK